MTMTLETTTAEGRPERYETILELMEKSMKYARSKIDAQTVLQDVYGDDFVMFDNTEGDGQGEENDGDVTLQFKMSSNALPIIFDDMMDNVQETVLNRMKDYTDNEPQNVTQDAININRPNSSIKERLLLLKELTDSLDTQDEAIRRAEQHDKESTHNAVKTALSKQHFSSAEDLMAMMTVKQLRDQKTMLAEELARVEVENEQLQRELDAASLRRPLQQLQQMSLDMEAAADTCSMITK